MCIYEEHVPGKSFSALINKPESSTTTVFLNSFASLFSASFAISCGLSFNKSNVSIEIDKIAQEYFDNQEIEKQNA